MIRFILHTIWIAFVALFITTMTWWLGMSLDPMAQDALADRCLASAQTKTGENFFFEEGDYYIERSYAWRFFKNERTYVILQKKSDGSKRQIFCEYHGNKIWFMSVDGERVVDPFEDSENKN